jgi:hypothetical protein
MTISKDVEHDAFVLRGMDGLVSTVLMPIRGGYDEWKR